MNKNTENGKQALQFKGRENLKTLLEKAKSELDEYLNCEQIKKLQEQLEAKLKENNQPINELQDLYLGLGELCVKKNQYAEGLKMYKEYYKLKTNQSNESKLSNVPILSTIGKLNTSLNYLEDANKNLNEALNILENDGGENDFLNAGIYKNKAFLSIQEGRYADALGNINQSLEYLEKLENYKFEMLETKFLKMRICAHLSLIKEMNKMFEVVFQEFQEYKAQENKRDISEILSIIGFIYFILGKYPEAEANYTSSFEECFKNPDRNFVTISNSILRVGDLCRINGEFYTGVELCEGAFEMISKIFGAQHPATATCHAYIGTNYTQQCSFDMGKYHLDEAFDIREKVLPEGHVDMADSYRRQGELCIYTTKHQDAFKNYQTALRIYNQCFSNSSKTPLHYLVATAYSDLARSQATLRKFVDAKSNLEKALDILRGLFDEAHPLIADNYGNMSVIYAAQNINNKQIEFLKKVKPLQKKIYGEGHFKIGTTYHGLANWHLSQQNYEKALKNMNKALQIRMKSFGAHHPMISDMYTGFGLIYKKKGDDREAIKYMMQSLQINLKFYEISNFRNYIILINLGALYQNVNHLEVSNDFYRTAKLLVKQSPREFEVFSVFIKHMIILYEEKLGRLKDKQSLF